MESLAELQMKSSIMYMYKEKHYTKKTSRNRLDPTISLVHLSDGDKKNSKSLSELITV